MKNTQTCPKCSGRKLFHIPEVNQPPADRGWQDVTWAFTLTAIASPSQAGDGSKFDITGATPCEAVVCAACGYTEWYASRQALTILEDIARKSRGRDVRVIDGPPLPPYR